MARPSEIVREAPAVLKIALWVIAFLFVAITLASHAGRPAAPAPCVTASGAPCVFHPHAAHGPGQP
jgi:hypothetical protein